jgi:hypothetical protein
MQEQAPRALLLQYRSGQVAHKDAQYTRIAWVLPEDDHRVSIRAPVATPKTIPHTLAFAFIKLYNCGPLATRLPRARCAIA